MTRFYYKLMAIPVLISSCIVCKAQNGSMATKQEVSISEKAPNILIIYPDQLRRYSAGFWSEEKYKKHVLGAPDPVVTPNMDRLAKNGVVFTQAISNYPLCSPARGMLLTGMYPEQNGIWFNCHKSRKNVSLKDDAQTITDIFHKHGYNTAYFGKCHWLKNEPLFDEKGNYVGSTKSPGGHYMNAYDTYIPPGPSRHNIEYFFQSVKDNHYNPHIYSNDPNTIGGKKDGEQYLPGVFSPKIESEKIVEYLQNKRGQRDSNKPFCMIWSLNPPHNPWTDKSTDMKMLKAHYDVDKYPKIDETLVVRGNVDLEQAQHARHYFANTTSVDYYIGKVLDELQQIGELDNTIVILSSDHGEMLGSHGKKGKNNINMEAMAIPFIVHWPKGLKGEGINTTLFSVPDVLPTIMGLAGFSKDIPKEVQGTNFSEMLLKPSGNTIKKPEGILLLLGNSRGILTDRYTLCLQENKKNWTSKEGTELAETFLYDNQQDPYQLHKIPLEDRKEVSQKLLAQLGKKLKETNDPWYQKRKYGNLIPYPSN